MVAAIPDSDGSKKKKKTTKNIFELKSETNPESFMNLPDPLELESKNTLVLNKAHTFFSTFSYYRGSQGLRSHGTLQLSDPIFF